jgi:hypothetical protein
VGPGQSGRWEGCRREGRSGDDGRFDVRTSRGDDMT